MYHVLGVPRMKKYDELLLDAIAHPLVAAWHGPPKAIAALQSCTSPTIAELDVGSSDGTERRVDATIRADDGSEWHVPFFVSVTTATVTRLWVYQRSSPRQRPISGVVVVINGASGVGKSTLLEALLDEAETPWIVFDEPHVGRIGPEYMIWRDDAPALHEAAFIAMRALAERGMQVATSAGGFSEESIRTALEGLPVLCVELRCAETTRWERLDAQPHLRPIASLRRHAEDVHAGWDYDLELDNDTADPRELARKLLNVVQGTVG